jgi:hypothetical protein
MGTEDIDLKELASILKERSPPGEPRGYLRGRSALRDMVREALGCSELTAEELVDTMEARGYLRYGGDPKSRSHAFAPWTIDPAAEL